MGQTKYKWPKLASCYYRIDKTKSRSDSLLGTSPLVHQLTLLSHVCDTTKTKQEYVQKSEKGVSNSRLSSHLDRSGCGSLSREVAARVGIPSVHPQAYVGTFSPASHGTVLVVTAGSVSSNGISSPSDS